ncbi:MAG: hypothetical protein PHQ64_01650 [Bacilli bacterium]|nr:hypothetical protein [Bacilli bacterium]
MGLLDKIKNTFFEEEYVEEEIPQKEKKQPREVVARKIYEEKKVAPVAEEVIEEPIIEEKEEIEIMSDKDILKETTKIKYFEDDDFIEKEEVTTTTYERPSKPYGNSSYSQTYSQTVTTKEHTKKFQPTPIISPIYGVLDKNYKKDEILEKSVKPTSSYVSRKNVDLDSIREKAFGDLSYDLGLTNLNEKKEEPVEEVDNYEDNLLYDMNEVDTTPAVEKVTLADAEEYFEDLGLEYNVDYKDAKHEKYTGRRVRTTPSIEDIKEDEEIEEDNIDFDIEEDEEEIVLEKDASENEKLEDNLFDLIDSMYKEEE